MKKFIVLIFALLTTLSCDVLDVEPQSSIAADAAFQTKEDIEKGILGAYSYFQSFSYYGRSNVIFPDLAADNLSQPIDGTASEYREIDNNNILPENGSVGGMWNIMYGGINVANNVIDKVPLIESMTTQEQDQALGELYFIRALNHFNLLNYFGAIPLKLMPTAGINNLDVPRDPITVVYAQIIKDLTFAAEHLPSSTTKIRASKYAAEALLARVYLYNKQYERAAAMATDVIENGGYTLLNDYAEVFAGDESSESIFEIYFSETERNRIAEYNFPKSLNGRREVQPDESLITAYEAEDARLAASIAYNGTEAYAIKYDDLSLGADNFIVLRLAEMYLIRAEARANLSNPNLASIQNDINTIRKRSGLALTTENSVSQLLTLIENERRVEFAFEGQRWFDLVRTGRAIAVLPNVTNVNQTLFPIPIDEIQTNNDPGMTQNPGY